MAAVSILGKKLVVPVFSTLILLEAVSLLAKRNQGMAGSRQSCQRFVKNWVIPALLACFRAIQGSLSGLSECAVIGECAFRRGSTRLSEERVEKALSGFSELHVLWLSL